MHNFQIEPATPQGSYIEVGAAFNAGAPYDLNVYLNGNLLLPSLITGGAITTQNDYQECDSSNNYVESGVGEKIQINLDIMAGDVIQFVWGK
jgi:hypothetical protein